MRVLELVIASIHGVLNGVFLLVLHSLTTIFEIATYSKMKWVGGG